MKDRMHNLITKTAMVIMIAVAVGGLAGISLAMGPTLRTTGAQEAEITGTYTLILYGGNYAEDVETIAFLDKDGDAYTFEPFAPDFNFRVRKGVPGKEALELAIKFVSLHLSFRNVQLGKVLDLNGNTIGYEVRPLYLPTTYGFSNVLDVWYRIKDGKVYVHVHVLPQVEHRTQASGKSDKND